LNELLRRTYLSAPLDVAVVDRRAGPPLRAHDVVLYLIDNEQRTLVPLGDPRRDDLKPMRVGLGIDPRAELRGYFRLFAKSTGSSKSSLKIDVLFYGAKGKLVDTKPYDYSTTSTAWQPTGTPKSTVAAAPIAFRFTAQGPAAHYQIDDVYVDPWARG
jgi:hypothetical protein